MLLLLNTYRRGGAHKITAVLPYFGYARQDRRTQAGEPVGAQVGVVVDDMIRTGATVEAAVQVLLARCRGHHRGREPRPADGRRPQPTGCSVCSLCRPGRPMLPETIAVRDC
ncbi:ribose-phosphate pyrophosphokinase-like domain-containing protein [Streptomyces sp. NPDC052236]|uniref:ribose-phosphate pyrophosphokinase-like domain-containing protein n=1 Tax=Streptomyces sp. NPDC052236 TaxID=3365686 RepID=UPI0037CFFADA